MSKLIVVIGATGNQGGSVVQAFLKDPAWRIRGLTRNVESDASKALSSKGVEMVACNLHDPKSLDAAFQGANLIFSVTDFWQPFFDPKNQALAKERGVGIGRIAYEVEYEQGKNIADAAAKVCDGLDEVGLIASTISNATKCSGGRITTAYHFDAKANIFPDYVISTYPQLAKKTSYLQTGVFMLSWNFAPDFWFGRKDNGTFVAQFPMRPDKVIAHHDVVGDTGNFAKTLLQLEPGSVVMAAGEHCSWSDYFATWGRVTGKTIEYKQVPPSLYEESLPGGFGKELSDMWVVSGVARGWLAFSCAPLLDD